MVGSFIALEMILAVGLFAISAARPPNRPIIKVTGIDAVAYYAVARSLLFDHDVNLTNEYATLRPVPSRWNAVVPKTGVPMSPFPLGYSLLQVGFIFLGTLGTILSGGRPDGYSQTCFTFYYIGNIVYVTAGLIILFHWLRSVGRRHGVSAREADWVAWIVAMCVWPATTLGYYTFSSMSHVAAFMTFSAAGYAWWGARDSLSLRRWTVFGVLTGLNVLCRWQDALLLMVPLTYEIMRLARLGRHAFAAPLPWLASRALALVAFCLVLTLQLAEWKAIFGSYFTIPQGQQMITWPPPHLAQVLLSSHNGWFTWTPIVLVGVMGLVLRWRRMPQLTVPILVALAVSVAFQGTVRTWHGDNFAMRMLTSSVALVAFGLAFVLYGESRRRQVALVALMVACGVFTILFGIQYTLDAIPKDQRLTFSEIFVDKVRLGRTLRRRDTLMRARGYLDAGEPGRSVEVLRETERRDGLDRNLLDVLAQAYRVLGDVPAGIQIESRLKALTESALF